MKNEQTPEWNEGYRHGLAQCNHHPEAPDKALMVSDLLDMATRLGWEGWEYTRDDHTAIEKISVEIGRKVDDLQTLLADIETLR